MSIRRHPLVIVLVGMWVLQSSLLALPLRFLPWDDGIAARKVALGDVKGVNPVPTLHPYKRSEPMDGTVGEAPLQLVALDRTSADGKPVAVDIKVAAGMQNPLVLILPDPKHPSGLRTFVIEDNTANFNFGTMRFINATGKALLVRHEQAVKALSAAWAPVDIDPGGQVRNMGIQLAARDNLKQVLYSAVWEHNPEVRKLIFVLPGTDVRTGAVEFKVIAEDRRLLAAEAAAAKAAANNPQP